MPPLVGVLGLLPPARAFGLRDALKLTVTVPGPPPVPFVGLCFGLLTVPRDRGLPMGSGPGTMTSSWPPPSTPALP